MSKKKMTGAEIIEQDMKDFEADMKSFMKDAEPKTPLEAAIDRATGFNPEDAAKAVVETEKPETGTEKPESETKKRDWVEETYKCFIKDAGDIDPTDPVKAVAAYSNKNATDELKARCKAEGKDTKGCWRFIEAVARKALHGSSGHIDPAVVYAIAMHWFEDVPKDWDKKDEPKKADAPTEIRKEKERMAKAKAKAKAKKPRVQQGFFFEMLETPAEKSEQEGGAE